jgi:hypothetical protein
MENTPSPRAADRPAPVHTTLQLIANGGVASPAYLDVERTLQRARVMMARDITSPKAFRALEARLRAHAEALFHAHVRETLTTLPSGLAVVLPCWGSDFARCTYRLLLTYREQADRMARVCARQLPATGGVS